MEKTDQLTQILHILAVVTNMVLLPQLLVLAVQRDCWLNQALKFSLSLAALVISITSLALTDHPDSTASGALSLHVHLPRSHHPQGHLEDQAEEVHRQDKVCWSYSGGIVQEEQSLQLLIVVIILIGSIRNRNGL